MHPPIPEVIRRRVIQLWIAGESRDKIASDLQIGAGTDISMGPRGFKRISVLKNGFLDRNMAADFKHFLL